MYVCRELLINSIVMTFSGTIIESVILTKEGKIEVVKRNPSGSILLSNPPQPAPDVIYKKVYGVVDGKIALIETIEGKHVPSKYVGEQFKF